MDLASASSYAIRRKADRYVSDDRLRETSRDTVLFASRGKRQAYSDGARMMGGSRYGGVPAGRLSAARYFREAQNRTALTEVGSRSSTVLLPCIDTNADDVISACEFKP